MRILLCILVLISNHAISQDLLIHKKDASTITVSIAEIDSITFVTMDSTYGCPAQVVYDGRVYNTVLIGDQCWIKENLNIGQMLLGADNSQDNNVIEKYCYNDDTSNCTTYGGLYKWEEVIQYSNVSTGKIRGICPQGWHLPTQEEFATLISSANNSSNNLKAIGQGTGAGAGTNLTGFSALLGGNLNPDGSFNAITTHTNIWSSTEGTSNVSYNLHMNNIATNIILGLDDKNYGMSVRCIKD